VIVRADQLFADAERLRQIFDLQDTDKSEYFGITELSDYFIIRLPSLFFLTILGKKLRSHVWPTSGRTRVNKAFS